MFLKRPINPSEQTDFLREHLKQLVKVAPLQETASVAVTLAAMMGGGSDVIPESLLQ